MSPPQLAESGRRQVGRSELVSAALEYHRLGLAVIPVSGKRATVEWKRYSDVELRGLFGNRLVTGFALLLGDGLCCLDFDERPAYETWAASHPDLVASLPTVETSRGRHVYFRTRKGVRTCKLGYGELRGEGSYVVVPPSRHPSGHVYRWVVGGPEALGSVEPLAVESLLPGVRQRRAVRTKPAQPLGISSLEEAVEICLPERPQQNDQRLFELARALLALRASRSVSEEEEWMAFELWYQLTGELGYLRHKREHYVEKFVHACNNAKLPLGEDAVAAAWARSRSEPLPECEARRVPMACRSKVVHGLHSLCWHLERGAGGGVWFLACGTAAKLLDCSSVTANTWLKYFVRIGILAEVECHTANRATRYRYLTQQKQKGELE